MYTLFPLLDTHFPALTPAGRGGYCSRGEKGEGIKCKGHEIERKG